MLDYGCESWKCYLELLMKSVLKAQKQLQNLRYDNYLVKLLSLYHRNNVTIMWTILAIVEH